MFNDFILSYIDNVENSPSYKANPPAGEGDLMTPIDFLVHGAIANSRGIVEDVNDSCL